MNRADIVVQAEKTTRPKRNVKKLFEIKDLHLDNSHSEESTDDDFVKLSVQRTKRKKNNVILEEATDVDDYRFECIYCDFKTTNQKRWVAHLDYKDRSRRKGRDLDEGGKNLILNPGKTLESENIESKLREEVNNEKITYHKDINDLKQTVLGVEEIQSGGTLESEDIEPKLYEEIDLDKTITYDKDTNELDVESKLQEEIVLDKNKKHSDLDEDKRQETESHAKNPEIITEEVDANWADINVEEIEETEDATVTKTSTSTAKFSTKHERNLRKHKVVKYEDATTIQWLECDKCDFETDSKKKMARHKISAHSKNWLECQHCEFKTKLKVYLERHSRVHLRMFQCDYCDFKTKRKKDLVVHLSERHTGESIPDWLKCDNCDCTSESLHLTKHNEDLVIVEDELEIPTSENKMKDRSLLEKSLPRQETQTPSENKNFLDESENIESKLHEEVDLDEKITCDKYINDLKQTALGVEEIQSEDTLESEDIQPKLYEEIDLDEKIICDKDINDLKQTALGVEEIQSEDTLESEDIQPKLYKEIDLDKTITCDKDTNDLREIELDVAEEQSEETLESEDNNSKLHEEIVLDKNKKHTDDLQETESHAKNPEIITEEVDPNWADINVEESEETEDATVTKTSTSTAKFSTKHERNLRKRKVVKYKDATTIQWLECAKCDFETNSKKKMAQHKISAHSRKWLECQHCEFKTKLKVYLERHSRVHSRMFQCEYCDFKTKRKKDLVVHLSERHTGESIPDWLKCDNCDCTSESQHLTKPDEDVVIVEDELEIPTSNNKMKGRSLLEKALLRQETQRPSKNKNFLDESMLNCDKCLFTTRYRVGLATHKLLRHNEIV